MESALKIKSLLYLATIWSLLHQSTQLPQGALRELLVHLMVDFLSKHSTKSKSY